MGMLGLELKDSLADPIGPIIRGPGAVLVGECQRCPQRGQIIDPTRDTGDFRDSTCRDPGLVRVLYPVLDERGGFLPATDCT
jgi:hypothetical protein